MTLHTRVAVTSGDVTPEAVFAQCRSIIGADKHQVIEGDPLAMAPGQGLPALMWVESSNGEPETCNEWCESDCSGEYHEPAHLIMAHFDYILDALTERSWHAPSRDHDEVTA